MGVIREVEKNAGCSKEKERGREREYFLFMQGAYTLGVLWKRRAHCCLFSDHTFHTSKQGAVQHLAVEAPF